MKVEKRGSLEMILTSFCQVLWESGVCAHACHTLKLMQ
jgi:hypothetical protein